MVKVGIGIEKSSEMQVMVVFIYFVNKCGFLRFVETIIAIQTNEINLPRHYLAFVLRAHFVFYIYYYKYIYILFTYILFINNKQFIKILKNLLFPKKN